MPISKKAGARIVIHDPEVPALPDEYGLDMQPNSASSIAIQMNDIQRKAYPFKPNCTSEWNQTSYKLDVDTQYTLASCQRFCLQEEIIQNCNCYHPNLVQSRMLHDLGDADVCLITPTGPDVTDSDYYCFQGILDEFDTGNRTCDCNVACRSVLQLDP